MPISLLLLALWACLFLFNLQIVLIFAQCTLYYTCDCHIYRARSCISRWISCHKRDLCGAYREAGSTGIVWGDGSRAWVITGCNSWPGKHCIRLTSVSWQTGRVGTVHEYWVFHICQVRAIHINIIWSLLSQVQTLTYLIPFINKCNYTMSFTCLDIQS